MKLTIEQSKRIQYLRGLAIIAVVFIHNTPVGLAQVFVRPFLNFSVGLFLFLSGMLSNLSKWNPKKRIIKVLVPYVLWTLIYSIMHNMQNPVSIPTVFLKNLLLGNAAGVMYYVFVYCQFTLLIPFIDKLARSRFKYWGFMISPLEIMIMRSVPVILGLEINYYISIVVGLSCIGWFTYFYLGYLIGNGLISIDCCTRKLLLFWMVSILFQMAEGFYYYSLGYENCGTQLKVTTVISGVLFALITYRYVMHDSNKNFKILKLLGDNSFGIYFAHIAVMEVIRRIPGYVKYATYPLNAIISLVLTTICVLLGKRILGKYSSFLAL